MSIINSDEKQPWYRRTINQQPSPKQNADRDSTSFVSESLLFFIACQNAFISQYYQDTEDDNRMPDDKKMCLVLFLKHEMFNEFNRCKESVKRAVKFWEKTKTKLREQASVGVYERDGKHCNFVLPTIFQSNKIGTRSWLIIINNSEQEEKETFLSFLSWSSWKIRRGPIFGASQFSSTRFTRCVPTSRHYRS